MKIKLIFSDIFITKILLVHREKKKIIIKV